MTKLLGLLFWLFLCYSLTFINEATAKNTVNQFKHWQETPLSEKVAKDNVGVNKPLLKTFTTDISQLRALLLNETGTKVISIPLPDGQLIDFVLTPSSIMADELAQTYPDIKTFTGIQVGNESNRGRFDITPNGFHGMFYYDEGVVFIEPETSLRASESQFDKQRKKQLLKRKFAHNDSYQSYFGRKIQLVSRSKYQFHPPKLLPETNHSSLALGNKTEKISKLSSAKSVPSQSAIKTYRLAISAAAEYSQFNGGTVDSAMAEIITLVNRLNEVYQRDLAVKLELVANNNLLVFINAATDPFANSSDDGEINTQVINNIIGNNSYDIGHVVGTGGGGLAILGAVCDSLYKGDGVTGAGAPNNDAFYIDYVAHEIGHQFGASHTFNGSAGACAGNRVEEAAYEVGSGSTIMSYAGICGNQNLQSHSDAFFHSKSIDEMRTFISSGGGSNCGSVTGAINNTAIVDAGADYTIPAHTPFILTGSASDVDSANLTYSWQQFDLGAASASNAEQVDDGFRPLFRVWSPVNNVERFLPKLESILTNSSSIGEVLPSTNRELNFRLLVRDGEGGVSFDANKISVVNTGEAFAVVSPLLNDIWTSNSHNISWQVALTNNAPINCTSVDILLSTDGGNNFTHSLSANVANIGSSEVSLAAFCGNEINTSMARVKVACSDNIFFAINNGNFAINKTATAADIMITSQSPLSINQGESITITSNMFTYGCDTPTSFTIENGNNYAVSSNTITPNSDFSGTLNVGIISHKEGLNSDVYMAAITVIAQVEPEPEIEDPTKKSSGSIFWLLSGVIVLAMRVNGAIFKAKFR